MTQIRTRLFLTIIGMGIYVMLAAVPAQAHHSFGSEYDAKKPVTLRGTVSKVVWTNPHAWIYIDVKKNDGASSSGVSKPPTQTLS